MTMPITQTFSIEEEIRLTEQAVQLLGKLTAENDNPGDIAFLLAAAAAIHVAALSGDSLEQWTRQTGFRTAFDQLCSAMWDAHPVVRDRLERARKEADHG